MLCRRVGASLGLVFGPGWVEWMSLTLPRGCHPSAPVWISGPSLLCQGSDVLRGLAGFLFPGVGFMVGDGPVPTCIGRSASSVLDLSTPGLGRDVARPFPGHAFAVTVED